MVLSYVRTRTIVALRTTMTTTRCAALLAVSSNSTAALHAHYSPVIERILSSFYPTLASRLSRSRLRFSGNVSCATTPRLSFSPCLFASLCGSRKSNGRFLLLSTKRVTCVTKAIITITVDRENKLACIAPHRSVPLREIPRSPIG